MRLAAMWKIAAFCLAAGFGVAPVLIAAPALAQVSISFQYIHDDLAPYGDWVYSDRWGEVWVPDQVSDDFQPYDTDGQWVYTDDSGWAWESDYPWGDVAFHYGRWVNDPDDGWIWIPGYVWAPAWVVWRTNGQYTGWMPMPPDQAFLAGDMESPADFDNVSGYYGYGSWYGGYDPADWVFVPTGHVDDRDFRRYRMPRADVVNIIHNTRNVTNITIVNNRVVDRGVDVDQVERASGRRIRPQRVAQVIKRPSLITPVDVGRAATQRERAMVPHGTGRTGSAPQPTAATVQGLSQHVRTHNGRAPQDLRTRQAFAAGTSVTPSPNPSTTSAPKRAATVSPPLHRQEQLRRETTGPKPEASSAAVHGPSVSGSSARPSIRSAERKPPPNPAVSRGPSQVSAVPRGGPPASTAFAPPKARAHTAAPASLTHAGAPPKTKEKGRRPPPHRTNDDQPPNPPPH